MQKGSQRVPNLVQLKVSINVRVLTLPIFRRSGYRSVIDVTEGSDIDFRIKVNIIFSFSFYSIDSGLLTIYFIFSFYALTKVPTYF